VQLLHPASEATYDKKYIKSYQLQYSFVGSFIVDIVAPNQLLMFWQLLSYIAPVINFICYFAVDQQSRVQL